MSRRWMAAAAATVVLAGCGGDEEQATSSDGPAQAVPAQGALVYAEALVKPGDARAAEVEAALFKVSGRQDVLDLLVQELDRELADDTDLSYAEDIEPWLGERAGVFFTSFEGDEPDGAVVLEVSDEEAARAALEKARQGFDDGTVGALVDGRLLIGTQAGVDAATRASEGESLGDSGAYQESLEPLDDERLGHVWLDIRRVFDAIPDVPGLGVSRDAIREAENPAVAIGFDVRQDRLAIQAAADQELTRQVGGLGEGRDTAASELLGDLPADAWLAFGVGGAGQLFGQGFTQGLQEGAPGGVDILGEIESRSGVDLQADIFEQVEDIALYASGTGLTSLGVGALLAVEDSAVVLDSTRRLLEAFAGDDVAVEPAGDDGFVARLQGAPFSIQVKRDGDRVAAGLGSEAADELLDPQERLADSDVYEQATGDLGEGANLAGLLQVAPMVELISSIAGDDPGWAQARPYVEAFERLSFGDRKDGDAIVTEIVARLR